MGGSWALGLCFKPFSNSESVLLPSTELEGAKDGASSSSDVSAEGEKHRVKACKEPCHPFPPPAFAQLAAATPKRRAGRSLREQSAPLSPARRAPENIQHAAREKLSNRIMTANRVRPRLPIRQERFLQLALMKPVMFPTWLKHNSGTGTSGAGACSAATAGLLAVTAACRYSENSLISPSS